MKTIMALPQRAHRCDFHANPRTFIQYVTGLNGHPCVFQCSIQEGVYGPLGDGLPLDKTRNGTGQRPDFSWIDDANTLGSIR